MQGMTLFTQILITLNIGMWVSTIGYAVLHAFPWRTGTETLCCRIGSFLRFISVFNFAMRRRAYREWGKVFYVIGPLMFLMMIVDEGLSVYTNLIPPIIGVTLIMVGWLINHWPPSEYWQRTHPYEFE
ncbi:MAG: hypothetical protein KBB55_02195 [Candidatus Buchananbacteria bacterium]|nr:hypothetical protein [Candidatus Buchananbacteria bacterium]